MNTLGNPFAQTSKPSQPQANQFANHLVESNSQSAGSPADSLTDKVDSSYNPFANALLNSDQSTLRQQQAEQLREQQKEALRRRLHDKVNPTSVHELFSSREEETKRELEQTRNELQLLISEFKAAAPEIEMAIASSVVSPGSDGGSYFRNFFAHLRQMIMLLRQRVSSARSWAQQSNAKKRKQKGLNYKKTKDVHSGMNNERNAGANAAG